MGHAKLARIVLGGATALALLVIAVAIGLGTIWYQPLGSLDGAFQTYSSVSEFALGHAIGPDFQSYLGVAMPLFLTPFYLLGGSSFAASCLAAALTVFVTVLLWNTALLRFMGARSVLFWKLFPLLLLFLWLGFPVLWEPGNSLRPLRWGIVPLLALASLPLFRRIAERETEMAASVVPALLLGAYGAIGILWSNDAGVPSAGALIGTAALLGLRYRGIKGAALILLCFPPALAATLFGIMAILSHGDVGPWLRYTFLDIPPTQFWLFAPWGEQNRIFSPLEVLKLQQGLVYKIALLFAALTVAWMALRLWLRRGAPAQVAGTLFLYAATIGAGLLPQIGGHIERPYGLAILMIGMLSPLILLRQVRLKGAARLPASLRRHRAAALNGLALCALLLLAIFHLDRLFERSPSRTGFQYTPLLGVWAPAEEKRATEIFRQLGARFDAAQVAPDRRLYFTYASALSIAAHAHATTRYPSVIHALGEGPRAEMIASLRAKKALFATSINPTYSHWELWNLRASWPIYRVLFENYEPVAKTGQQIVWRAAPHNRPRAATPLPCTATLQPGGNVSIEVGALSPGAPPYFGQMQIDLDIEGTPPARWFWEVHTGGETEFGAGESDYVDAPRYGQPGGDHVTAMLRVSAQSGYAVTLKPVPARAGNFVRGARCTASTVLPVPDFAAVPTLTSVDQIWPVR